MAIGDGKEPQYQIVGQALTTLAAIVGPVYLLGLAVLQAQLASSYNLDQSTAWFAATVMPKTVVAVQGVLAILPLSLVVFFAVIVLTLNATVEETWVYDKLKRQLVASNLPFRSFLVANFDVLGPFLITLFIVLIMVLIMVLMLFNPLGVFPQAIKDVIRFALNSILSWPMLFLISGLSLFVHVTQYVSLFERLPRLTALLLRWGVVYLVALVSAYWAAIGQPAPLPPVTVEVKDSAIVGG